VTETICPVCGVPRPQGAKQCICNYTFEDDKLPARGPQPPPARDRGNVDRWIVGGAALLTAVVVAALFHGSAEGAARGRPELGFFLIAAGIFAACGGIFAWDFFMSHRRARLLARFLGRTGTRYFYGVLGGALAGAGVVMALLSH
jgi:hypothetical protein